MSSKPRLKLPLKRSMNPFCIGRPDPIKSSVMLFSFGPYGKDQGDKFRLIVRGTLRWVIAPCGHARRLADGYRLE